MVLYHQAGQALAIPSVDGSKDKKGGMLGIVEDNTRSSPFMKMLLVEAKEHRLKFKCVCNPTCTVEWIYRLAEKGHHAR